MQRLRNISKRTLAALMFFTRLPLWRIATVERSYFERVVPLWPLAGWLTGGVMALVLWCSQLLNLSMGVGVALALLSRCLLTGALHEDGFADFCDGFGGGTSRERTLSIMKDSHIGTYGVLGLILYILVVWNVLTALIDAGLSPLILVVADALAKGLSSTIIYVLPYARTETDAKNRLVYVNTPFIERLLSLVLAFAPLAVCLFAVTDTVPTLSQWLLALLLPACGCVLLFWWMHRRLQGYTGDCCGATFIITETLIYLSLCLIV